MDQQVLTTGYAPRDWQLELHAAMATHRWCCAVVHRRGGKTVAAVNAAIAVCMSNSDRRVGYFAPTIKAAKGIALEVFKEYTREIPGMDYRIADAKIVFPNGSEVQFLSGELHDACRGMFFHFAILDEYALFPPDAFSSSIRYTLSDTGGGALFISTPRGQGDPFFQAFMRGQDDLQTEWWSKQYAATDTNVLSHDEIEDARKSSLTPAQFEREMLASFEASTDEVLIPISLVRAAMGRSHSHIHKAALATAPKVIGVDPAGEGKDRTVIACRWGDTILPLKALDTKDLMVTVGHITQTIDRWGPVDGVFIDHGGLGQGITNRLNQLGYDAIGINFGGRAIDADRFLNRRAEMWHNIKRFLEDGGSLPEDQRLIPDLCTPEFSFDASNRLKLEGKAQIRKRLGASTDFGDAIGLVLAQPVHKQNLTNYSMHNTVHHNRSHKAGYDPFEHF